MQVFLTSNLDQKVATLHMHVRIAVEWSTVDWLDYKVEGVKLGSQAKAKTEGVNITIVGPTH